MPAVLSALLNATLWDTAAFWLRVPGGLILGCEAVVSVSPEAIATFESVCRTTEFDEASVRAAVATGCGLTPALSVPIRRGASDVAVLELFARSAGNPHANVLEAVNAVADRLRQFLDQLDVQAEGAAMAGRVGVDLWDLTVSGGASIFSALEYILPSFSGLPLPGATSTDPVAQADVTDLLIRTVGHYRDHAERAALDTVIGSAWHAAPLTLAIDVGP